MKKFQTFPYEFLFLINGNPIVGRNFQIKNFNSDSISSIELKETIDNCVDIIKEHFKDKSSDYLYKYHNYYSNETESVLNEYKNVYEDEDTFSFQIKVKDRVVAESFFTGNDFPPKVRYDVDIRNIIPRIIETIQHGLNGNEYTQEYCGYDLTYRIDHIYLKELRQLENSYE